MTNAPFHLATVDADTLGLGARALPPNSRVVNETVFWDGYDTKTLIYDGIWRAKQKTFRLFLPKLFNFEPAMQAATFAINGTKRRAKIRKFRRFDMIDIAAPDPVENLQITTLGTTIDLPISATQNDLFAGRNVICTMHKDGPLEWVQDWVLAHQRNHGADAVLIADNASTSFTSAQLLKMLKAIPGIKAAAVINVPHPYAPHPATTTDVGRASFLQTACLNIMRDRFLQDARAVLICDVDELITAPDGQSIFDATVNSPFKYKPFTGVWRFPDTTTNPPRHANHTASDLRNKTCANKYCIVPDSVLGRLNWSVHSLEKINRRIFVPRNPFRFYHCRAVNTSWKQERGVDSPDAGPIDPATLAYMKQTFGPDTPTNS